MRNGFCLLGTSLLAAACFNPEPPPEDETGTTTEGTDDTGQTSVVPPDDTGTTEAPTGDGTDTGIDPCEPNPCQNGGTCGEADGEPVCNCPEGFSGSLCEQSDGSPCDPNPCQNDGTCVDEGDTFSCECAEGWEGDLCDADIDDCAGEPCQNGGVCTDELGGFSCECIAGFEGDACEVNIDDCAPNPCLNNQPCIDGVDSFSCDCAAGFSGDLCECSAGPMVQVNYTNQGTFQAPMLYDAPPGVTVTGSNDINVLNLNGLGIVGGIFTNTIDGNEWIQFEFDSPSISTSYFVNSAGNQNGDGQVGAAFVEAFDEMGASLGVQPVDGTGTFNLNAFFGATPISRFVVTANVDNHRIANVSAQVPVCL